MTYETPIGANMFAYCGNNPVVNIDPTGDIFGTLFDIASLGYSIYQAAKNPDDPMTLLAVAADAASLLLPFVSGGGAAVRAAVKASKIADNASTTQRSLNAIKAAASNLPSGTNTVYLSFKNDVLEYVGITNDFARRQSEWEGIRDIVPFVWDLDRQSARYVEQAVIDTFGMSKNGGILSNKINSIGPKNPIREGYTAFFDSIWKG